MLLSDSKIKTGTTSSARKFVKYKAELAYGNSQCSGYVGSLSSKSLYIITFPTCSPLKLVPGTTLQVKIAPPAREPIYLQCRVTWAYETPPHKLTRSIGMEIIDSLPDYSSLLKRFINLPVILN